MLVEILFWVFASILTLSALGMITVRNPVHSALLLVLCFFTSAAIWLLIEAEFLAVVLILVYVGAVMVLFLFVVMLINYRQLPEERVLSKVWLGGIGVGVAVFVLFFAMVRNGVYADQAPNPEKRLSTVRESHLTAHPSDPNKLVRRMRDRENRNSEAVAMQLYSKYLVPFEVASLFLLVAMIGAIVIGKRELSADEEESTPQFILERAEVEKEVKEAMSA